MKQRAPATKQKTDTEELLNFELDEESSLDLESLTEDEAVIDLVDLVEKGDGERVAEENMAADQEVELDLGDLDLELESAEVTKEPSAEEETRAQGREELDLSDLTMELGGEHGASRKESETSDEGDAIQADLDNLFAESEETVLLERGNVEAKPDDEDAEITDADLDGLLEEGFGEAAEETAVLAEASSSGAQESSEIQGSLDMDQTVETAGAVDVKGPQVAEEKVPEPAAAAEEQILEIPSIASEPPVQELAGLSEEKLEMMITRVVEDVVQRVARETMTDVAERLITEAIDSLKRSMELSETR